MPDCLSEPELRFQHVTTRGVPPGQRLSFWRDTALRRMEPIRRPDEGRSFSAEMRRLTCGEVELWEHASSPVGASRTPERLRMDGRDDIGIEIMRPCGPAWFDQDAMQRVDSGSICIVDYGRPHRVVRPAHVSVTVMLPRERLRRALGTDLDPLVGRILATTGLGEMLRSHLQLTLRLATSSPPQTMVVATRVAVEMALALLQMSRDSPATAEGVAGGLYAAARNLILHQHADPLLTPGRIARALGCSRATLYRVFAEHDQGIAELVWSARLDAARRALATSGSESTIGDIAHRSGFADPASFSRMFRRHFGMSPRELRASRPR